MKSQELRRKKERQTITTRLPKYIIAYSQEKIQKALLFTFTGMYCRWERRQNGTFKDLKDKQQLSD